MSKRKPKQIKWNEKINQILNLKELTDLKEMIIFQESDGSYQLFDKYTINRAATGFVVTSSMSDKQLLFSELKNATSWCIFDKRDKFYQTNRIYELDSRIGSIDVDIRIHHGLYKRAKTPDDQVLYIAKLNEDRIKRTAMIEELAGYTAESRSWQTNRFNQKPV